MNHAWSVHHFDTPRSTELFIALRVAAACFPKVSNVATLAESNLDRSSR